MDRRQQKTRQAVFDAFTHLLEKKNYAGITVQDIIDEANIGRSTFYSHFETKDELLRALCTEIFDHVFAEDLSRERTHDFSDGDRDIKAEIREKHLYVLAVWYSDDISADSFCQPLY